MARLHDNVAVQDVAALQAAAVLGTTFDVDLLVEVAGGERAAVLDALAGPVHDGVLRVEGRTGRFLDATARAGVYDAVRPSERERLHGRAADALDRRDGAGRATDPEALAGHLLAAGREEARAVRLLLAAGERHRADGDAAAARRCADRALEVADSLGEDDLVATGSAALGGALLAAGHTEAAAGALRAAVAPARRAGRPDLLAAVALGLGGGATGFEVPQVDREQLDLLEEALERLADDDPGTRARVLARLSVAGGRVRDVRRRRELAADAVGLAEAAGDDAALGAALAAQCDAHAGPEHAELRRGLAGRIVAAAERARDRELELLGRRHLLLACAELGDLAAVDAEVRDFTALAALVRQPRYGWYVPLWRGMRALLAGRAEECRQWNDRAAAEGASAGSVNAFLLTTTLRWVLLAETADAAGVRELSEELELEGETALWADVAMGLFAAETGRPDEARTWLDSLAPRLADAERESEWLPMLAQVAELVGHVGGHPVAGWTYEALAPFGDLLVVEGIGAAVRGSVHRPLGILAASLGSERRAAEHFDDALAVHRRIGAPLLVARTLRDRGVALRDREALGEARDLYARLGIAARVADVERALGVVPASPDGQRFVREGETWAITWHGRTVRLRDSKGLRDLARLLGRPGTEVPAVELAAAPAAPARHAADAGLHPEGDLGEVLDATARQAYRRRLAELEDDLDRATDLGDDERAARARAERDALVDQLSAAYGLGGRPRRAGQPAERARTAVTARIRDAIRRIAAEDAELGQHLERAVRTGTLCAYDPEHPVDWTLS